MKGRVKVRGALALGAAMIVAVTILATLGPNQARPGRLGHAAQSAQRLKIEKATIKAELADLASGATTVGVPSPQELTALTTAPGMPSCAPPPIPPAASPPGQGYGIPFLAAITNGQVLAGYDEWTANHLTWTVHSGGQATTYNLNPWQSKIYDITGWVSGLLQLPNLTADIPPQDIVFCDNQGGASCLSADWPAGQCIHILAQYGPSPASPTPPPALGNDHPEGTACSGYSTPTFNCFPYVVSLTPSGDASLSVTGVESTGALDLQVTTAAVTTVTEVPPAPSPTFTCQGSPTTISLSTVTPSELPPTAPGPPNPPNTDLRTLQSAPQPLTGPLAASTSTLAGNDFAIPAFVPSASGAPCSTFLATSLNTYAGGWNSIFKDQAEGLYYLNGGNSPVVAPPGWAQFSATTTVVSLGLPVGPPAGFQL
ncbi:MAG TPA: hypothetical protein VID75_12610 [Acidimicrobiales bacterium]